MRPRELDDEAWLRDRYGRTGDAQIASELGCSRETVALARRRLGIAPRPRGRPCGSVPHVEIQLPRTAAELVAERIARELSDSRAGAGPAVVALRVQAIQRALTAGDQLGLEDAVASAAAALGVWLEHLQCARASDLASGVSGQPALRAPHTLGPRPVGLPTDLR